MTRTTALAAALLAALALPVTANAAAHPVATATQIAPRTFILDASSSPCRWSYCDFSWRAYGPSYNRLGGTAGFGPSITWIAPAAGVYALVVTESERCAPLSRTWCPGSAQVNVTAT